MRVLFDQDTPVPLRNALSPHVVETAYERGWQLLTNGELLDAAEAAGFELVVTTDQGLWYQRNLASRRIRILVLKTANWPKIEKYAERGSGYQCDGNGRVPRDIIPGVIAATLDNLDQ